ncbi:hypothetical protein PVK06_016996 [Gossypium arboreum]|uniref:Uncharacterized protein n=1 Tax=Gossypium arboreum TaxID=29729 RepID=A0ABR0Q297_GOSAR|nr:hypothetical protein PVK06_016996 [Gossypium arboreum]
MATDGVTLRQQKEIGLMQQELLQLKKEFTQLDAKIDSHLKDFHEEFKCELISELHSFFYQYLTQQYRWIQWVDLSSGVFLDSMVKISKIPAVSASDRRHLEHNFEHRSPTSEEFQDCLEKLDTLENESDTVAPVLSLQWILRPQHHAISATIDKAEIVILVDYGSTHNFVDSR